MNRSTASFVTLQENPSLEIIPSIRLIECAAAGVGNSETVYLEHNL